MYFWNYLEPEKIGHHNKEGRQLEFKVNGKLTNNPAEVVEALSHYCIDSVATIAQCFSPEYTNVCPVNTMEPALSIRNVTESEVTRMIRSLNYIWYGCSDAQRAKYNTNQSYYQNY